MPILLLDVVDLVSAAGIAGVNAASVFKDDVSKVCECQETHEVKCEVWCLVLANGFSRQGHFIENGSTKVLTKHSYSTAVFPNLFDDTDPL
jgi:hypothetical protein